MANKNLWMRSANFEKIKDLLHLVKTNNGKLRAMDLERKGIDEKILIKTNGKPLTHTPRYYYRKVMENLDLIHRTNNYYFISESKKVYELLENSKIYLPLSEKAKEIFAEIVIQNEDCKSHFFNLFMKKTNYTLNEFREFGEYIFVETSSMNPGFFYQTKNMEIGEKNNPIILKNKNQQQIILETKNQQDAVYDGVRKWASFLGITDEIMLNFSEGRLIYPIQTVFPKKELENFLVDYIKLNIRGHDCVLVHIPTFIREAAIKTRSPIEKVKEFLNILENENPQSVMFIPSSSMMIDLKSPFEKHDALIRNLYVYKPKQGYISHLRVYRNLLDVNKNEPNIY